MTNLRTWAAAAVLTTIFAADAVWALSDRMMTVVTMTFTMPPKVSPACNQKITAAKTQAEGLAALNECKIPYARDTYSRLKSKTPAEDYAAALAAAPIGQIALKLDGDKYTYFIVLNERVVGMASISNTMPVRRVLYEGMLTPKMQKELGPIHDMDGVIRVLAANNFRYTEDTATLFIGSVPEEVGQALIAHPGDPYVIQRRENGVIYARRNDGVPQR